MKTCSNPKFTLGVQAGDETADRVVAPHYLALRRLLGDRCVSRYSSTITEFAPVLRIDGAIWHWERSGHGNTRIDRKSGHATVDVFVPTSVWKTENARGIRGYLAQHVRGGFMRIADRARSKGIDIDQNKLLADVDSALKEFLS